jgi:hypothetical protein
VQVPVRHEAHAEVPRGDRAGLARVQLLEFQEKNGVVQVLQELLENRILERLLPVAAEEMRNEARVLDLRGSVSGAQVEIWWR